MAGYTKLFNTIITSTIWREDDKTRIVWITMLALADASGKVDASLPGLADVARVTVDECRKAILVLSSPDPNSRSKEYEGRRIKEIEGGWLLLNYPKYRNKMRDRAAYYREYRQRNTPQPSTTIRNRLQPIAEAEADSRSNVYIYTLDQVKDACILNEIPEGNAQSYFDQYNSQGWKKANGQPITNLQSHIAKRWNKKKQCWDFDESKEPEQPIKPSRPMEQVRCLVDQKLARLYSMDKEGNAKFLCDTCAEAFRKQTGHKNWGLMSPTQIEKIVLQGKAKR